MVEEPEAKPLFWVGNSLWICLLDAWKKFHKYSPKMVVFHGDLLPGRIRTKFSTTKQT